MKKGIRLIVSLVMTLLLVNCNSKNISMELQSREIDAQQFLMCISTPTILEKGKTFTVEGTLKYTGDKSIKLYYGNPIINFYLLDKNGEAYQYKIHTLEQYEKEIQPGQTFEVKEEMTIDLKGKYQLIAETSYLEINKKTIKGAGNENQIKKIEDKHGKLSNKDFELENSKLTIDTIYISAK